MWQHSSSFGCFTLICAIIEDIECLHCCRAPLLVTKDQINPLMKVG